MFSMIWNAIFGERNTALRDTIEVFRENAEQGAERAQALRVAALGQFAAEFTQSHATPFDRFMDGVNRLPRPMLALGTLGLMIAAMVDPNWFAARMAGVALVPEPLWWLLGIIVSFYFGARAQVKSQDFQRAIAASLARIPQADEQGTTAPLRPASVSEIAENPALAEWLAKRDAQA